MFLLQTNNNYTYMKTSFTGTRVSISYYNGMYMYKNAKIKVNAVDAKMLGVYIYISAYFATNTKWHNKEIS